jgi:type VII secretion integral membrane protein EccD
VTSTQHGATSTPGSQAPLVPSSCRVSILVGESTQIDVVLPAAVPLAALADPTRDFVNRQLRQRGEEELPPGTYEFARAAGMTALSGDTSLAAQGMTDSELVALVPRGSGQRYGPNIEDVSTALAKWAKDHFPAVSKHDSVLVAVALTGTALALAALMLWRIRWAGAAPLPAAAVFGGAAVALIVVAMLCARLRAASAAVDGATIAGLSSAVLAGATAPPGAHPGAAHAFLAAVVACTGAVMLARFTHRHWIVAAAVITVGAAVVGTSAVRMFWPVPGQRIAVVVLIGVLVIARIAPSLGRRMARVPRQSFGSITGRDIFARAPGQPEDTLSPVESAPHDVTLRGEQVGEVARRANRVLTGVLVGVALVELVASIFAINPGHPGQWPVAAVVAVVALILVLRARAFRDRRHAIAMVCGAALSLLVIPAHYGFAAAPSLTATGLWSAAAVLGVAAAALAAAAVVPSHFFSEPVREAVEYLEYVLVALVVPFAAWAIGVLHYIRFH